MADETLDDLELELRRLPGVRAAGFDQRDDLLLVQLHVALVGRNPGLPVEATRVAVRHADRPVAVEVVRWRDEAPTTASGTITPALDETEIALGDQTVDEIVLRDDAPAPSAKLGTAFKPVAGRARLLAVLSFPDTEEVEVHLVLGGRRTIGRAPVNGGLPAVADATIEALDGLGSPIASTTLWARPVDGADEGSFLVAVALRGEDAMSYGLACGSSPLEATARATLDSLNRRLAAVL